jgi:hypothetical protein
MLQNLQVLRLAPQLRSGSALPLPPIRPNIRAYGPAFGADHPRSEQRNLHIPGPMIDVDDGLVPALVALDRKRPHLNEKDQRLAKGVANVIRNVAVGSGHQLRITLAAAVP